MSRVSSKPYFVYVLWSCTACRFYIGISDDVEKRLTQHNEGLSKWTAKFCPWELVHAEEFPDYSEARRREILLKRQKGSRQFFRLTGLDPSRFSRERPRSGA